MTMTIATADDIRSIFREEFKNAAPLLASLLQEAKQTTSDDDDIIKGAEEAGRFTGKAAATIYGHCSRLTIPHSKQSGLLYFSKRELRRWMLEDGKRETLSEIQNKANQF